MAFWLLLSAAQPTNRNEISDLFNREIENKQGLESFLESSKAGAETGITNKQGMEAIGISESAVESKTSELNSINANNLESAGQGERAKEENAYYETLEVDYANPQIINHKRDIDKIAQASEKLVSRLTEVLKEVGIDCKTTKSNKEIEPQYYLDIQKEQQKDVTYNQHICEQLRNRYSCNNVLTVKCLNKIGGELKETALPINYVEKYKGNYRHWFERKSDNSNPYPGALKYHRTEFLRIKEADSLVQQEIRQYAGPTHEKLF